MVYSTYLGGGGNDGETNIAVDLTSNDILVVGHTQSTDFPTVNPVQPINRGGRDAFVARLLADGTALVFSTYLGGAGNDTGTDLAVDLATDDVIVGGRTASMDFPTSNPLQSVYGGGISDAFVARLNASGSALVFSTYLGGSNTDASRGITVDPTTGDALLTGTTFSTNYPTANPLQPETRGDGEVFMTRIAPSPVASFGVEPFYAQVTAGVAFDLTVTALDAGGFLVPDYTGEVLILGTDEQGTTPLFYTFRRTDRGAAVFPGGVTFRTPGVQVLLVLDTATFTAVGLGIYEVV